MSRSIALVVCLGLSACVTEAPNIAELSAADATKGPSKDASAFFEIRPDYRKCMFPMCGGYWVSEVGAKHTRCADGKPADACYVATADWSAIWGERTESVAIVHGTIRDANLPDFPGYGEIAVDGAWHAVTGVETVEDYWAVTDDQIVCITFPCYSAQAELLNAKRPRPIALSGFDTSGLKLTDEDRRRVWDDAGKGNLITTGDVYDTPDGGTTLVAEEVFVTAR